MEAAANNDTDGFFNLTSAKISDIDKTQNDNIPDAQESLRLVHPDPNTGFSQLSSYLVNKITKEVMLYMREMCRTRKVRLDIDYWEQTTRTILAVPSTADTLIAASPPGSGKSTWIEAFTKAFVNYSGTEPKLAKSLSGAAVVLQKVEDLNRLAEILNHGTPEKTPNMVALQGWSRDSQKRGFCKNHSVSCFDECAPSDCPFAQDCELLSFHSRALSAPVVGLTQERFSVLRNNGNLDSVLYRINEDGHLCPRRYLIFDEKFQMAQINTLDKDLIDNASQELTKLISKISATDSRVRGLQQRLSYTIEQPFQKLRKRLCCTANPGGSGDIQAGFCTLTADDTQLLGELAYADFRDFVIDRHRKYATKSLREAFSVMDELYAGKSCLFSKTNGFAVSSILPPQVHYGECQTIIFDATAEVDLDYLNLTDVQLLSGTPKRKPCNVTFYIYSHKDLNVSKSAMAHSWKVRAFSQLIGEIVENIDHDVFICTYKNHAEAFADTLQSMLSPKKFKQILLMPDREHITVPYLGGTNGSNCFSSAATVFMLGYPRLNPKDYLISTCAAYGEEQLFRELGAIQPPELTKHDLTAIYSLPSVNTYISHHLAARLEQEIYRCAMRSPNFDGSINIHLFCPPKDMLDILLKRIPGRIINIKDIPVCADICRGEHRSYKDGKTSLGRLSGFLDSWDGSKRRVSELRSTLNISAAVWKDMLKDQRLKILLKSHGVHRSGRGANAVWYIPGKDCA